MKVGYQILADLQQQQAFKQWGFTNNTGRPYITFPFKFSNVFTAISCICHNGSPSEANTVYNVSISGMNIGASGGGSGKYWCAFGVAQQQWGKTISGNNVKTKFPIAFTAFCMLSVSVNSSNGNAAESVFRNGFGYTNKTLSDWILRGPTGDATYFADYIAIGCQPQWGYGNSESTQTFPIKFTNSVIGIYGSKRAINYEYTFAATSITNTNFFMSTRNSEGNSRVIACNWLAIGQQQTK